MSKILKKYESQKIVHKALQTSLEAATIGEDIETWKEVLRTLTSLEVRMNEVKKVLNRITEENGEFKLVET